MQETLQEAISPPWHTVQLLLKNRLNWPWYRRHLGDSSRPRDAYMPRSCNSLHTKTNDDYVKNRQKMIKVPWLFSLSKSGNDNDDEFAIAIMMIVLTSLLSLLYIMCITIIILAIKNIMILIIRTNLHRPLSLKSTAKYWQLYLADLYIISVFHIFIL